MMETKVFIVLCSLLLVNFGSTNHDEDHAAVASSPVRPPHVPQAPQPAASLPETTKGLSGTVATEEESPSVTPDSKTDSNIVSASKDSTPPPTSTHPHTRTPSPPKTTQPTHTTPPAESPNPQTISPTPPTNTSTSPSSTSLSAAPPSSESPTLTPPQTTTPPRGHPEALSTDPPSSSPPQAKAHAVSPAQINARDDTTMVHDPPTLDPLLAGLVSAFIITAIIITLLLFLKLRQRDARPEFRRLQDLPMDDMMEDTPLSMYSY
ncbi:uncharacterized protein LOC119216597 isoform X2 [Pungitius pungitius]|uniref:uncharacterized protein LOC119216597 isoform X2 n=1 Tax=Pungitius pungitius TaxID=134920 RepID=UPI002E0DC074